MQSSGSVDGSPTPSARRKAPPYVRFNPFGEGSEEVGSLQKRQTLIRVWLTLLATHMVLLGVISVWAVHRSHQRDQRTFGTCYLAPRMPGDRRADKNKLSIANFNAEWLFMRGGHGDIRCPSESCPWATKAEALEHMRKVASVLTELDADIVNLNEVEDCRVMEELLAQMPRGHGYKFYLIQGDDAATGQSPGILTRVDPVMNLRHSSARIDFPVLDSRCQSTIIGTTGCTKHYITRFVVKNERGNETAFVLAGLHLLAKPLDQLRCARREAQATIIRELVEGTRRHGDRVIIAGDFNDYDSQTLGASGEKSITSTLDILKSGLALKNAATTIPMNERYSCWFDRDQNCIDNGAEEHTLIDHVLVSQDWAIRDASFYHKYAVSCRQRVSDHWPFTVVLDLQ